MNDVNVYSTSKKLWIQVDMLTSSRSNVGVASLNSNTVIVIGGTSVGGNLEADLAASTSTVEIGYIVCN